MLDENNKDLIFTTGHTCQKAKNILQDHRVSVSVDDQTPLYSFVIVERCPDTRDQPNQLLSWATKIVERYVGRDKAEAYGKRNSTKGELLVRIKPTKIIGQKDLAA